MGLHLNRIRSRKNHQVGCFKVFRIDLDMITAIENDLSQILRINISMKMMKPKKSI